MPCSPAKARHLLDDGKAKVKKRTPFTIQLVYGSSGYTQEVILGVDAGSKTIGMSASTNKEELFAANVTPRNDVVDLLSTRREFRRDRRIRTTRYRQPRFNNRVRSKHKGWLAPSVEVKIQEHITAIKRVCNILPVSKVVVETAEFDLQLLKAIEEGNPIPQGEDYQRGEMYGHYNVRQYVLWRDGYTFGYRLFDKVLYQGVECFVFGRRSSGYFLLKKINGEKVKDGVSYKHLRLLERSQSYLVA